MKNNHKFKIAGIVVLIAGLLGCQRSDQSTSTPSKQSGSGEVVAEVGSYKITLADFEERINEQNPLVRSRYQSEDQKTKLLNSLVEQEAMVMEAKRLGLDKDPEVVRGIKKIMARHLVDQEFNKKKVKQIEISDEEIKKYYEENHDRYHSPEKLRVHHIFFAGPVNDQAKREDAEKRANNVLTKIMTKPKDRRFFLQLAKESSDDEKTRATGGDTNFKSTEDLEKIYGREFTQQAFKLQQTNDLSPVFSDEKGFYILRHSGKQSAVNLELEKVKGQIRTTLFARARGEAYKAFVEEVKKKAGVQVFADIAKKAKIDLTGNKTGFQRQMVGAPQKDKNKNDLERPGVLPREGERIHKKFKGDFAKGKKISKDKPRGKTKFNKMPKPNKVRVKQQQNPM
jgi:peptidyl-prolyl cis-trans isomerase C